MRVNGASTICSLVCTVIEKLPGRCYPQPMYWQHSLAKQCTTWSLSYSENKRQYSGNDFSLRILSKLSGEWLPPFLIEVLAAFRVKNNTNTLSVPSWNWALMECQWLLVLDLLYSKCCKVVVIHRWCHGCLVIWNNAWHVYYPIMKLSVNGVSTIFGLAYWVIKTLRW